MPKNLYLVGARASGKTSVGMRLADALGRPFADTDQVICAGSGLTIAEIVEREGWESFRGRESAALEEVAGRGLVVATGGGMVLCSGNRRRMRETGVVIYLSAPAVILAARLAVDPGAAQRPSLTGKGRLEEIEDIVRQREALYREVANYVVDAAKDVAEIVDEILAVAGMELEKGEARDELHLA